MRQKPKSTTDFVTNVLEVILLTECFVQYNTQIVYPYPKKLNSNLLARAFQLETVNFATRLACQFKFNS